MENYKLNNYAYEINKDVSEVRESTQTPVLAFTSLAAQQFAELYDIGEPIIEHCTLRKKNGDITGEIHGYCENADGTILYLFYSCYNTSSEIGTKNNTECQVFINRAQGVYSAAIRYKQEDYDFDSAEYRALKFIYDNNSHYDSIHIVLFSNFLLKNVSIKRVKTDQKPTNLEVWDLMRLYKLSHSMSDRAAIDIDFSEENYQNYKIPYIMMESPSLDINVSKQCCRRDCCTTCMRSTKPIFCIIM